MHDKKPTPPFQGAGARVRGAKFPKKSCLASKGRHLLEISLAPALPDAHPPELGLPSTNLPAPPAFSGLRASKGSQSPFSELGNEFSAQPVKSQIVIGVLLKSIGFGVLLLCRGLASAVLCAPHFILLWLEEFPGLLQISLPASQECQDSSHP